MTFYNYFKAATIFMVALVGYSFAAKVGNGKITYAIGDATLQKSGQGDWKPARSGMPVKQADKVRTLMESQVVITLPDGSSISVEENSIVELSELLSEDGKNKFAADIKSGRMKFDIQKQTNGQSSVKFKTGTATAAIRGTSGVVGRVGSKEITSVAQGLVEVSVGNKSYSVKGGQTALSDGVNVNVIDMASSGNSDVIKELEKILADSTISLDSIAKLAKYVDKKYQEELQNLIDSLKCSVNPIPDTIYESKLAISVQCPVDVYAEISNKKGNNDGTETVFTQTWAPDNAISEKKFPVTCRKGRFSKDCGTLKTTYVPPSEDTSAVIEKKPIPLQVKNSSVSVCDDGALIEGTFDPAEDNAKLFIEIGDVKSPDLATGNTTGEFSYKMSVSDALGNWNEKTATVTYTSNSRTETATVSLDVEKNCKGVNTKSPTITYSNVNEKGCIAYLTASGMDGDIVTFVSSNETYSSNEKEVPSDGQIKVFLTRGVHDYTFQVEDLAGNTSSLTKTLGCYPKNDKFSIKLKGPKTEVLRIPPPPLGVTSSIYRNLHFSIDGLDGEDPIYIKEIIISQKGQKSVVLNGSGIAENSFDYQVELPLGVSTTKIDIEVTMKNGTVLNAQKTYEVNKK